MWDFIRWRNLEYVSLYDEGYKRVGCVGCPIGGVKGMERDFERYPKIKLAYERAFDRMIQNRIENGLETNWQNGEAVMQWWIYGQKVKRTYLP